MTLRARFGPTIVSGWLIWLACLGLAWLAVQRLSDGYAQLLGTNPAPQAAVDLRIHRTSLNKWFAGKEVYWERGTAFFPASYPLYWPFVGWLSFRGARYLWAATATLALLSIAFLVQRTVPARSWAERVFFALLPLSCYATHITLETGQFTLHVLAAVLISAHLLRSPPSWGRDIALAAFFLFSLIKPSLSAPFFWLIILAARSLRPAGMVVAGYALLTLFAVSMQSAPGISVLETAVITASNGTIVGSEEGADLTVSRFFAGGETRKEVMRAGPFWSTVTSLSILALLGLWIYFFRRRSLWTLMGLSALIARVWTYHRLYDDLLILIVMLALFRVCRQTASPRRALVSGVLAGVTLLSLLGPVSMLTMGPPFPLLFKLFLVGVWCLDMVFLIYLCIRPCAPADLHGGRGCAQ